MPIDIDGRSYTTVAERLDTFRKSCKFEKGWAIRESIERFEPDDFVLVKCEIVNPDNIVIGVGHAHERFMDSDINQTSAVECASTSALGRALAALGYHGTEICSAQELYQAKHASETLKKSGGGNVKGQAALEKAETFEVVLDLAQKRFAEKPKLDVRWVKYCQQVKKAYTRLLDAGVDDDETAEAVDQWLQQQRGVCRDIKI